MTVLQTKRQLLRPVLDQYQRLLAEHRDVLEEIRALEYRRANRWAAVLNVRHTLQEDLK